MVQLSGGIGNVTTNTGLVEMAMAYSRSRMLCAAARLGIADALGDKVSSVAESCRADADALYRLLRALASIGVTGGDNARTLSADSVWQTVAEECASVRVASRHLLVGSTRR
jgi:hypothetical protein